MSFCGDDVRRLSGLFRALIIERASYARDLSKHVVMDDRTTFGRAHLNSGNTVFDFLKEWDEEAARKNKDSSFVRDALIAHEKLGLMYDSVGDLTLRVKDLLDFECEGVEVCDFLDSLSDHLDSISSGKFEGGNISGSMVLNSGSEVGGSLDVNTGSQVVNKSLTTREIIFNYLKQNKGQKFKAQEIAQNTGLKITQVAPMLSNMIGKKQAKRVKGKYFIEDEEVGKNKAKKMMDELSENDKQNHAVIQDDLK